MRPASRAVLDDALSGEWPDDEALLQLVLRLVEDQYFELKGPFQDKLAAAREVRRQVAAFANAEGGILVLGISDQGRKVEGWPTFGATRPQDWFVRTTAPLLAFLGRPPIQRCLETDGKTVLVVAVDRAPLLVPVEEDGVDRYFVRSGDSSVVIPQVLVTDLVLGRRAHPEVAVRVLTAHASRPLDSAYQAGLWHEVMIRIAVRNESLACADRVTIGGLYWSSGGHEEHHGRELLKYVDVQQPGNEARRILGAMQWRLRHRWETKNVPVGPFFETAWSLDGMMVPAGSPVKRAASAVAIYVAPWAAPPSWFQLTYNWESGDGGTVPLERIAVEACWSLRPQVAWIPKPETAQ